MRQGATISTPAIISIIVAAAENGVIGRNGDMPWRIPSDLKTFRRLTVGKPVIMGRKTFASLGKPLPGRDNIVITRDPDFRADGVTIVASLHEALIRARSLALARGCDEVMVIGGGEIYRLALPQADRVYLTRVEARPEGDATFPELPADTWRLVREEPIAPGPGDQYNCKLTVWERRTPAGTP